jgi:DNA polymerase III subunit chi
LTRIDFYFNAADRLQVACRLSGKAHAQGKRVVVYAPAPETAQRIDRLLWTSPATAFVPHCMADDALAAETPVLIALAAGSAPASEVLLNLHEDCPEFFARHDRLLEIVSQDDGERRAARARYAWYRDRGYPIHHHDLAAASGG